MGNFIDCKCSYRDNNNDDELNLQTSHISQ